MTIPQGRSNYNPRRRGCAGVWSPLLVATCAILAAWMSVPSAAAPLHPARWQVGSRVTISGVLRGVSCHLGGDDSAPLLAVDPRDASRVEALYFAGNALTAVAASSRDGGRTWSRRAVADDTPCSSGSDARLVDAALFVSSTGRVISSVGWTNNAPAASSTPHEQIHELTNSAGTVGASFRGPVDVEPSQPDQRGFLTERGDRLYLETERFSGVAGQAVPGLGGIAVLSSADGGTSWQLTRSQPLSLLPGHQPVAGGIVRVGSRLVATWADIDLAMNAAAFLQHGVLVTTIRSATSTDGGVTWTVPVDLATCGCTLPRTVASPDGSVLMSWEDQRPGGHVDLARSTDAGATWSLWPVAPSGHVEYGITAPAANAAGTIAVLHETAVPGGSGRRYVETLATSDDGGRHWDQTPISPVEDQATYTDPAYDQPLGAMEGLVAVADDFLAAYTLIGPVRLADGQADAVVARVSRRAR